MDCLSLAATVKYKTETTTGVFFRGFTEFYRVVFYDGHWTSGITGFYWVLLCFTGFYVVLLGFTGFHWILLDLTWFYWVLLGFAGFEVVLLGFTVFFTGFY